MQQRERKKAKSARFFYIAILPIVAAFIVIFSQQKYGPDISSLLSGNQPNTEINQTKNKWAKPIELPGLPNLHKVSDNLYRGAQPNDEGMKQLEKLGIKTIINLRAAHSDRDEIKNTKLTYHHIRMTTWNPEKEDIVQFLKIVTDSNNTPVFVHCKFGADRTGAMCALYRIVVEGWSKDEAIEEMTKGSFGFHSIWDNLIGYINNLDIDIIKNEADLNE
ncbi:MAG: dual specificity protein phosphatase family protein [Sedimentisphaerales bacterium]|nr:dual specificity protein phosphatase family protein [Sedimentisphaerales bacterium]